MVVHMRFISKLRRIIRNLYAFDVGPQIALANQSFNLFLQSEAILSVMSILTVEMAILGEVFIRSLAHLSEPANNIMILYFNHDLLSRGV